MKRSFFNLRNNHWTKRKFLEQNLEKFARQQKYLISRTEWISSSKYKFLRSCAHIHIGNVIWLNLFFPFSNVSVTNGKNKSFDHLTIQTFFLSFFRKIKIIWTYLRGWLSSPFKQTYFFHNVQTNADPYYNSK
jgi:hypothetical protein